jgi:SNF2 family DNA or RNA helicase
MSMTPHLPGGTLYPYQLEALEYLNKHQGRVLIADEMGVGKTPNALGWLWNRGLFRALVICPATIKLQWARESLKWLGFDEDEVTIVNGIRPAPITGSVAICNYDILSRRLPDLLAFAPRAIILDESHYLKEAKSKRSKTAKFLCQQPGVESVVALTGTPVLNRPKELWHQIQCINPRIWPNWYRFAMRYCDAKQVQTRWNTVKKSRDRAWDFSGASNLDELDQTLRSEVMVRRRKVDVMEHLPELQTVTVPFEVNLSSYKKVRKEVQARLAEVRDLLRREREHINNLTEDVRDMAIAGRAEGNSTVKLYGFLIQEITKLKKEAAIAKLPVAIEWIKDFTTSTGEPLVVFTHHHELSDALWETLGPLCGEIPQPLDGRMSMAQRQKYIDEFIDGKYPILICGLKAMGMGVDGLQHRASHLAFMEFGWSPSDHAQAASRLHRQGQENAVTAHYLLAADTLDERIAQLLDAKATVTSAVVGEMDTAGIMESIVDAIAEEG